ncbi:CRISPR-associated endonuclease Cas1 [Accumulibacter sp.]|uniref:CRISPR-associated endonuclease Cas1 n=2 Tax=Accumulibacter sp. TaxID=2053492 RepID=UPI00262E39ED|nr:CRISPR-associated endonuclease Cas1 [Accumulibacter sp.]
MALLDELLSDDTLTRAWTRVRHNGGAPGVDGMDIDEFGRNALIHIGRLRDQVRDGRYAPAPLRRVELPRAGRAPRRLAVPTIRDRVLQTAAALVLGPLLDPTFEDESFAFRPGRSVRDAVARVVQLRDMGLAYVVDADISDFFDHIPHLELVARLAALVPDRSLLPLVRQWLAAPVQTGDLCFRRLQGISQGSPLSPLLANLYLDGFDEAIAAHADWHLVRYADDFVILCADSDSAERALEAAANWLTGAGLELNFAKTRIALFGQGVNFLGVHFTAHDQQAVDPAAEAWLLMPHLRRQGKAAPAALVGAQALGGAADVAVGETPVAGGRASAAEADIKADADAESEIDADADADADAASPVNADPTSPALPAVAPALRPAAPPADRPLSPARRPSASTASAVSAASSASSARLPARALRSSRSPRGVRYDEAPPPLLRTLYLAEPGAYLRLDGGRIVVVKNSEELLGVPLEKVDQVFAADEGAVSFAVLRTLLARGATFVLNGTAGEPPGMLLSTADSRAELRRWQYRRGEDPAFCLAAARAIVAGKIANGRLLLRRHYRFRPGGRCPADADLRELQRSALRADDLNALRGVEGAAARAYFASFAGLLPSRWPFPGRRRQPASDPVNALLSYGYAVLFQNLLTLIVERGLDPFFGCLHALRDGHPALVSDLMEEFRALTVDAVVLNLLCHGDIRDDDFSSAGEGETCRIGLSLRKVYLAALEGRFQGTVTQRAGDGSAIAATAQPLEPLEPVDGHRLVPIAEHPEEAPTTDTRLDTLAPGAAAAAIPGAAAAAAAAAARAAARAAEPAPSREAAAAPARDFRRAMRAQVAHWIDVLQGAAPAYRPFVAR